MSSVHGQITAPGFGAHCTAKFALEGLTQTLSQEVDFDVTFLITEPGAFRTGLFNHGAAYTSAPMPEYAATVGPIRQYLRSGDGTQPSDPAKAAQAILTALEARDPPLRLVLGGELSTASATAWNRSPRNWANGRQSGAIQPRSIARWRRPIHLGISGGRPAGRRAPRRL